MHENSKKHPHLSDNYHLNQQETAIARFPFTAQKDKDLSFDVGDIITIEKKR
jgi:hypothetical protein